jgi:alkanesulfonate monooxygenase SsuD/methylene tetrahydromethanopterin reductase-like flavin-dependent oxidoreductase (luciferase family)
MGRRSCSRRPSPSRLATEFVQFHLYLPQLRMSFDRLVASAQAAEAAGFAGIAGMDHLAPPAAERHPMYEAMVTNTWLAAHTEHLTVGSLVLCDAFRHPAVLARQAVSLDHASGGRFELGIGWGSWADDFSRFGVEPPEPAARAGRLRETLEVLRALWSGETVDYDGTFHHLRGALQMPGPVGKIPIVIGGTGPKTLALVREYADWWNVPVTHIHLLERGRSLAGDAHVSIQQTVAFVGDGADRDAVAAQAARRFGRMTPVVGAGPELVEHFGRLRDQGIERVYTWFSDFAPPDTVAAFGAEVIGPLSRT